MRNGPWLAFSALLSLAAGCAQHAPAPENEAPTVPLATVRSGDLPVVLAENGTVGSPSAASAQLAFVTGGTIAVVNVRTGERVTAGEPLASLDARSFALAAQGARADAGAAAGTAAAAGVNRYGMRLQVDRAALERAQRLYSAGVVAQKDVDDARATLAQDAADASAARAQRSAAQSELASAQAKVQVAQADLDRTVLRSPIDGVVAAVLHRAGETVDSTTPVLVVAPASQDEVTLRVPASDAAQIEPGDPVALTISAMGAKVEGRVARVVNAVDPSTQAATVIVTGAASSAAAGSAVRAEITVSRARGLLVPAAAIVSDPQSGNDVVFVREKQRDGSFTFAPHAVTVAQQSGASAIVSTGVRPGDRVAARGAFELLAPAGGGD